MYSQYFTYIDDARPNTNQVCYFLVVQIVYRTKKAVLIHDFKKMYRYKCEFFLIFH